MSTELLHNPDTHRLGKKEAKPPRVMVDEFVDFEKAAQTISVPANIIHSATAANPSVPFAIALAMYLNDNEGDCTCAGVGNIKRIVSDGQDAISDSQVQDGYVYVTREEGAAFDPQTGQNDNGCVELDVLDAWASVPLFGGGLLGHAGVDFRNKGRRRLALYLFGPLYPGWQLSTDQQSQEIWAPGSAAPGSWGGHCAPICDDFTQIPADRIINGIRIPSDILEIVSIPTWEQYKLARGSYIGWACDELHVLLTQDWVTRAQSDPVLSAIVDQAKLQAVLRTFRQES